MHNLGSIVLRLAFGCVLGGSLPASLLGDRPLLFAQLCISLLCWGLMRILRRARLHLAAGRRRRLPRRSAQPSPGCSTSVPSALRSGPLA